MRTVPDPGYRVVPLENLDDIVVFEHVRDADRCPSNFAEAHTHAHPCKLAGRRAYADGVS
jgi:hypothetical protein